MPTVCRGLLVLLAGTCFAVGIAHGQEPPAPDAASIPAVDPAPPSPAPSAAVAPAAPVPLAVMTPESLSGFRRPEQPPYSRARRPSPAQDLAMLEAGQPLFASDPRVAVVAVVLEQLTATYVEDAPRIVAITIRAAQQVRAANQAASPLEILIGAAQWNGPGGMRGNVPRKYEEFARLYRTGRLEGKDHASALSLMQAPLSSPPPAGLAVP